jgi:hypothetical protein
MSGNCEKVTILSLLKQHLFFRMLAQLENQCTDSRTQISEKEAPVSSAARAAGGVAVGEFVEISLCYWTLVEKTKNDRQKPNY